MCNHSFMELAIFVEKSMIRREAKLFIGLGDDGAIY